MTPPGVPALRQAISFPVNIATGAAAIYKFFQPKPIWGIFKDKLGKLNAFLETGYTVEVGYKAEGKVSTAHQEKGSFVSYSFTQNPDSITVKVIKNGNKTLFLDQCNIIAKTMTLYYVVTPNAVYSDLKCQGYRVVRNIDAIDLIEVEFDFLEIRLIDATVIKATTSPNAAKIIEAGRNEAIPRKADDKFFI